MFLYMAVTADEIEQPLIVEEYQRELARKLGISVNQLRTALCRHRKTCGVFLRRVEVSEDDEL